MTEAARETMRRIVDQLESVENPPESIQQKLLELALELRTVSGKKQYGYLKKPLKDMVDSIVDELEKLPEVAEYYAVWNDLRDTLEGYYKSKPRQHNSLSQQKEFRAIKNAIIQEAERLRLQLEESSAQASTNPTLASENTSSVDLSPYAASIRVSSEFNNPPVPPDGTNLPRERCAAQQSNGYPRGLQATQKAHPKAAGDGP